MFFSSPDVFSPSTSGGRRFARPIFPHGEVSGEASNAQPGRRARLFERSLGERIVSRDYSICGQCTTSVPGTQANTSETIPRLLQAEIAVECFLGNPFRFPFGEVGNEHSFERQPGGRPLLPRDTEGRGRVVEPFRLRPRRAFRE